MSTSMTMSPLRSLWLRWKKLKLPWRKTFLVGQDLQGNTFWEFKDTLTANRLRRIVRSRNPTAPFSDIAISPQWHQWLRHTRQYPPSLQEQHGEIGRQAQIKYLAQQADERWASKPSFLDKPAAGREQPMPATVSSEQAGRGVPSLEKSQEEGSLIGSTIEHAVDQPLATSPPASNPELSPRKPTAPPRQKPPAKASGPAETWQPEAWTPMSARKR